MCNPGVSPTKTDEELVAQCRRLHKAFNSSMEELRARGISVNDINNYPVIPHQHLYIYKVVTF